MSTTLFISDLHLSADRPALTALFLVLLRELATRRPVYVMHGNRDFLLGNAFAQASGCRLLADPSVIDLNGERTLLMHGDVLCTDDVEYQQFRAHVRNPETQQQFLAMTIEQRIAMARQFRDASRERSRYKTEEILDVNQVTVAAVMRAHDVRQFIHGHTHRPASHRFTLDGREARRIVLGDWYEQGSVLGCDEAGCRLEVLDSECGRARWRAKKIRP